MPMLTGCPKRPPSWTATVRRCPILSCLEGSCRSFCLADRCVAAWCDWVRWRKRYLRGIPTIPWSPGSRVRRSLWRLRCRLRQVPRLVQCAGKGRRSRIDVLADCTDTGALRGYARAGETKLAALLDEEPSPSAAQLLGKGYLAFTVDQGPEQNRQQGIVTIEGASRRRWPCTIPYQRTASLLCTPCLRRDRRWLACGRVDYRKIAGAGAVDPSLDAEGQKESWRTATTLAATLTEDELLDDALPPERLLYRLFHSEGVAVDRACVLW